MIGGPKKLVQPLRLAASRRRLRRRLRAVLAGSETSLHVDLNDSDLNAASVFLEVTRSLAPGSPALGVLVAALRSSGSADRLLDGLVDGDPHRRDRCARLAGAVRLDAAAPWLGAMLHATERPVRYAAARALGRIGGARCADLLLGALRSRRLPASRLIVELCRAAPDLYIESNVLAPQNATVRAQLAAAAGLRGRRSSLEPLQLLAIDGTDRERSTACRALGLIRDPAALPALSLALEHRSWRVRRAATRALGEIGDRSVYAELHHRLYDPHPSTRYAAARAMRLVRAKASQ